MVLGKHHAESAKFAELVLGEHHAESAEFAEENEMNNVNDITADILNAAFKLHTMYGPGLYESAYELLMQIELHRLGHKVERQKAVSIEHEGVVVDNAFRLDLLIDGTVIVELKSTEQHPAVFAKQLKTYLVLCGKPVGLLINFGQMSLKNGIERVVNRYEGPTLPPRTGTPKQISASSA